LEESSSINNLDRTDRQVLKLIRADGWLTISNLAKKVSASATTCHQKMQHLSMKVKCQNFAQWSILQPLIAGHGRRSSGAVQPRRVRCLRNCYQKTVLCARLPPCGMIFRLHFKSMCVTSLTLTSFMENNSNRFRVFARFEVS